MDLDLVSGWLCLDFANTVEPRHGEAERDHLGSYPDVIAWARHAAVMDGAEAERLLRAAATQPSAAQAGFTEAIGLREAIYGLFSAVASGTAPPATDLDTVQEAYTAAMRHAHLSRAAERFVWTWDSDALDRPWWPVARSAVELATAGPLDRVKLCPTDEGCAWLFVDVTKNRSRRWCSMDTCGAGVKARRQTARRRAARSASG